MRLAALVLPAALAGCAWFEFPAADSKPPGLDLDDHLIRPDCRQERRDPDHPNRFYCTWLQHQYEMHERARRREARSEQDRKGPVSVP